MFGSGIWDPLKKLNDVEWQAVKVEGYFQPYLQLSNLLRKIDGDVIYASKPLFTSYIIGLIKKLINQQPCARSGGFL